METEEFIEKWSASDASERANTQPFLYDLCEVLGVEKPKPATGNVEENSYCFERDAVLQHEGGGVSIGKMDLFKAGCFILEAKQGSEASSGKTGTAKRRTPGWHQAMRDAYGQALGYAATLDDPPPFIVVADIGFCFDLFACFNGSGTYHPFPTAQSNRIFLTDLAPGSEKSKKHLDALRTIFTDPLSLDPSKHAAKVTREVTAHLAELARQLEKDGHGADGLAVSYETKGQTRWRAASRMAA